ncbi:hypothetical protein ACG9ZE_22610, partial [Acinetobacter sp. ULE_I053]|uniref:hypothetical protein n=1 Tax=Acinetobacter sp. ULE_I053 TaxID=3373069 RepID=UPI003AF862D2
MDYTQYLIVKIIKNKKHYNFLSTVVFYNLQEMMLFTRGLVDLFKKLLRSKQLLIFDNDFGYKGKSIEQQSLLTQN